jgi:hypothetical protein
MSKEELRKILKGQKGQNNTKMVEEMENLKQYINTLKINSIIKCNLTWHLWKWIGELTGNPISQFDDMNCGCE